MTEADSFDTISGSTCAATSYTVSGVGTTTDWQGIVGTPDGEYAVGSSLYNDKKVYLKGNINQDAVDYAIRYYAVGEHQTGFTATNGAWVITETVDFGPELGDTTYVRYFHDDDGACPPSTGWTNFSPQSHSGGNNPTVSPT
jgi:hypothetical protein